MLSSLSLVTSRRSTQTVGWSSIKLFFVPNRPPPKYDGHVPLTNVEKVALGIGAATGAFLNPHRAGECPVSSSRRKYAEFRERFSLDPDERDPVRYIDNEE
ncbi:Ubiquinone biosynthesis protein coq4, mitochondrial [Tolypocladium ophioglossoides CBS 100239]|uniref:Ubiquinone biosynthesis protein coq4, mitochondrial n=1 Tax=Tolypocladium ophioglossoides (strain CBS 100239) TaxID=1163406 RepID=A0A0L0N5N1_TOLOC|nr:Ubiquinone biosynthesis protein coq4, mitochondrial [Tolypocladium ophioglossoides CBS 100239]